MSLKRKQIAKEMDTRWLQRNVLEDRTTQPTLYLGHLDPIPLYLVIEANLGLTSPLLKLYFIKVHIILAFPFYLKDNGHLYPSLEDREQVKLNWFEDPTA